MPYEQKINKYSIYIHLQEDWKSYPSNLHFEIINVWSNQFKNSQYTHVEVTKPENFNYNQLLHQKQREYVELKHEFSDCKTNWKPILYRYVLDTIRSNMQYWSGERLSPDPYVQKYPDIKQKSTKQDEHFAQFIPICTNKEITNYEYSVKIDAEIGFDVYFVPSVNEFQNFVGEKDFEYYKNDGCYGRNFQSFSGTCLNIKSTSGLLLLIPDDLNSSLTKITISLHELP